MCLCFVFLGVLTNESDELGNKRCWQIVTHPGDDLEAGTVFLETNWKFLKAVKVGETITASVSVTGCCS